MIHDTRFPQPQERIGLAIIEEKDAGEEGEGDGDGDGDGEVPNYLRLSKADKQRIADTKREKERRARESRGDEQRIEAKRHAKNAEWLKNKVKFCSRSKSVHSSRREGTQELLVGVRVYNCSTTYLVLGV